MVSPYTTLVPSLGLRISQPMRQASALACEGSVCHPMKETERKKISYISDLDGDMSSKFALQIVFDLLKTLTSPNPKQYCAAAETETIISL